jgi:hypothetical protein
MVASVLLGVQLKSRMNAAISFLIFTCLLLAPTFPAKAWSGPGHMLIAAEAYKELLPDQQNRVTQILKAHRDYANLEASYTNYGDGTGPSLFIFMRASTWPDEIRRGGGSNEKYDHPQWLTKTGPCVRRRSQWNRNQRRQMTWSMASPSAKKSWVILTPRRKRKRLTCRA